MPTENPNGLRRQDEATPPAVVGVPAEKFTAEAQRPQGAAVPVQSVSSLPPATQGAENLPFQNPQQMAAAENAAILAQRDEQHATAQRMAQTALVQEINLRLQAARLAKQYQVDGELLRDLRQRSGEYDPDTMAAIRAQGGSQIFDNITEQVCAAIKASIAKVFLYQGEDLPYGFAPSELPELPPDAIEMVAQKVQAQVVGFLQQMGVQKPEDMTPEHVAALQDQLAGAIPKLEEEVAEQMEAEAQKRADRLEKKMRVLFMEQSGFVEAFGDFLDDFATYPMAHLVGPVPTFKMEEKWDAATGRMVYERKLHLSVRRVSNFDVFQDASSLKPNDGGFRIRWLYARKDITELLPPPGATFAETGVIESEVRALLEHWDAEAKGPSTLMTSDAPRAMIELRYNNVQAYHGKAEGFQFVEPMDGRRINDFLRAVGLEQHATYDDLLTYWVTGIIVGNRILQLIECFDKVAPVNVYKACYRTVAGAYVGRSAPSLMREEQTATNTLRRASLTNSAAAARPDKMFDRPRLINPTVSDAPGQKYFTKDNAGHTIKPVEYLETPFVAGEMDMLRDRSQQRSFNKVGVQPYNLGDGNTAASQETLGAFKLLIDMQSDIIKDAIFQIDCHVVRPLVRAFWRWLMEYDPDPLIKGDINIFARGALELYIKEQDAQRRLAWLQATNNPTDMAIIGIKGRAEQLAKAGHSLGVGRGGVPEEEDLREAGSGGPAQPEAGRATKAELDPALSSGNDQMAAAVASAKIQREQAEANLKKQLAIKAAVETQIKRAMAVMQLNGMQTGGLR